MQIITNTYEWAKQVDKRRAPRSDLKKLNIFELSASHLKAKYGHRVVAVRFARYQLSMQFSSF